MAHARNVTLESSGDRILINKQSVPVWIGGEEFADLRAGKGGTRGGWGQHSGTNIHKSQLPRALPTRRTARIGINLLRV